MLSNRKHHHNHGKWELHAYIENSRMVLGHVSWYRSSLTFATVALFSGHDPEGAHTQVYNNSGLQPKSPVPAEGSEESHGKANLQSLWGYLL